MKIQMSVIRSILARFIVGTENKNFNYRHNSQITSVWPGPGRLLALLMLCALGACANVCAPLNVSANGPFPAVVNGLDYLDWGSVRVQWTTDASASSPVTSIKIVYATAAEWAANPGVYPHTQGLQGGGTNGANITSSTQIMGGILANISPNTTYHVIGQAMQGSTWCSATDVSFTTPSRPANWTGPTPPAQVNVTQPAMTGTHWVYGSNCGTTAGTTATIQTANWQDCLNKAGATPGSDISAAPGTYQINNYLYLPNNPAWQQITCSTSTNTCTQASGTPPASGTTISFYRPPAPVNPGVLYKIINVGGSSFQISFDGVNPITLQNAGGYQGASADVFYMPYPLPQSSYITIHPSTYGTNLLPPPGVRLGPDAIAQYQPNMITFEDMDPTFPNGFLIYSSSLYGPFLAGGWWFQNVAIATDPTVATNYGNGFDPIGFRVPFQIGQDAASTNFVFNQCAFLFSLPPSRSSFVPVEGSNLAVVNSYQQGLDWWQGHLAIQPYGNSITNTSSTLTFPAMTASWVGPGGSVGTKQQCPNSGGTWTISGGSTTTAALVWIRPSDCYLAIQTLPGLTVSTTGQVVSVPAVSAPTVTNVGTTGSTSYSYMVTATDSKGNEITGTGSPYGGANFVSPVVTTTTGNATLSSANYNHLSWPAYAGASCYNVYNSGANALLANVCGSTSYNDQGSGNIGAGMWNFPQYVYKSPTGNTNEGATVFAVGGFTVTSGAISAVSISNSGASQQYATFESNTGFEFGGANLGPYLFDNNYMTCTGVCGLFLADDPTLGGYTPCNITGTPCAIQHNPGDLSETRSTVTTNPCYFYDATCWNGGNYYFRNVTEVKQGKKILQDGNQYGPFYPQIGYGECVLHETYNGGDTQANGLAYTGFPTYTDSNEWQFTNNTCNQTGEQLITGFRNFATGAPMKNFLVRNNLFINLNEYLNTPVNQPYNSARVYRENVDGSCPDGAFSNWTGSGQNVVLDHNTIWGQGGCLPVFFGMGPDIQSGVTYTNNIYNVVTDPGYFYPYKGSLYQPYNTSDTCWGNQGVALLNCYNLLTYGSNVALFTYTNSFPGSSVEFSTSDIANLQASPSAIPTAGTYIPAGNTLAARLANTGWFNACTLTSAASCVSNLRLLSSSPFISGAHASTDGLDIGANIDQLEQHQGKVSNVRALGSTSTSTTIALYAPDSKACSVDWGNSAFYSGSGSWTRVSGSGGQRVQTVALTGLPAHGLVYYRVNCAVQQPTGSVQLP
jgi:hypothetical protein